MIIIYPFICVKQIIFIFFQTPTFIFHICLLLLNYLFDLLNDLGVTTKRSLNAKFTQTLKYQILHY